MTGALPTATNRYDLHDWLPLGPDGRLSRSVLLKEIGLDDWLTTPTVTVFGGSRAGNDPAYKKDALEISTGLDQAGIAVVTGGAPDERLGIMSAITDRHHNFMGVAPFQFADRKVKDSGVSPRARKNVIVYDYYPRKPVMSVSGHLSFALYGGFGTLEETTEEIIKTGGTVHYLNVNGFWNPTRRTFAAIEKAGLMPDFGNREAYVFHDTIDAAVSAVIKGALEGLEKELREETIAARAGGVATMIKPGESLQSFLRSRPHLVPEVVLAFAGDAPRIGITVSGNISADPHYNQLNDTSLTKDFCERAETLGRDIARKGGVVVLSGDKNGLREIIANSALHEGGKVIWVQNARRKNKPLSVSACGDELTFTVARDFENFLVYDLVAQSYGFLAGGLHTLDRVFEILTREQTLFGGVVSYPYLLDEKTEQDLGLSEHKPVPLIGHNVGDLWSGIAEQTKVFHDAVFIEDHHVDLLRMIPDQDNLAASLVECAHQVVDRSYDLLKIIAAVTPRRENDGLIIKDRGPYSRMAKYRL